MEEKVCISCLEKIVDFVISFVRGSVKEFDDGYICEDCQYPETMFSMDLL